MLNSGVEITNIPIIIVDDIDESTILTVAGYDVIGIDEAQFYPSIAIGAQKLANSGKIIVAAGLDATSASRPFARMPDLCAIAEDVIKLHAVCQKCYGEANFSHRISNSGNIIEVGGADKYMALCRNCMWNDSTTDSI
jgi:thymidine kinase